MAQAAAGLAAGFTFCPQDRELIDSFLRPKLAGQTLHADFIHDVDVYSAAPDQLVAGLTPAPGTGDGDGRVWYFISPVHYVGGSKNARGGGPARKSRTVGADGNECWHSETGPKPVKDSAARGCFQKFSYKIKTASGVVKPGWLMVEYSIDSQEHGGADLVLCKVYRSPRAPPRSRASSAALPESGSKKRKAADHDHPEAPPSVRPQLTNEHQLALQEVERMLMSDDVMAVGVEDAHLVEELTREILGEEQGSVRTPIAESDQDHAAVEFVQTVHGACPEYEVIARLAAGETVDDLLGPCAASSWSTALAFIPSQQLV